MFLDAAHAELLPSTDIAVAAASVNAVPVSDDALERDRILLINLLVNHPDIAHRSARPGHLTGSAFVVNSTATEGLLMFHTKLQRWLQPGGHADGDTNLASVALQRSEERRVGKECLSQCRSRWSPYH